MKNQAISKEPSITRAQLLYWLGSDNTYETMLEILIEFANFDYDSEGLQNDVLNHWANRDIEEN